MCRTAEHAAGEASLVCWGSCITRIGGESDAKCMVMDNGSGFGVYRLLVVVGTKQMNISSYEWTWHA